MNFCRNIFKITLVLFTVLMIPASSFTYVPKNWECTVKDEDDTPGNPSIFSLRGRVELGFNPTTDRACHDKIKFLSSESYTIVLKDTITFDNADDGDSSGDGVNMEVNGGGATVVIDGRTNFDANKCVFVLKSTGGLWANMKIKVHKAEKAFCNAAGNPDTNNTHEDGENGLIIEADQPSSVCGNGTVEGDEQCDGGQCCKSNCEWKSNGSSCNDGDSQTENDKCNSSHECHGTPVPYCGDGNKDPGEDCDGGQCCNASCHFKPEGTTCNDGSILTTNDECNATGECHGTPIPICGDGTVASTEGCDDGNTTASDGCSATCTVESGYTCSGSPSVCTLIPIPCGNGALDSGETCDDANTAAGDGCSGTCTIESGYTCSGTPSVCTLIPPSPVCGNGTVESGEECDDTSLCCDQSTCHYKAAGTACDDGNSTTTNDVCNASHVCAGTPDTTGGGGGSVCPGGAKLCPNPGNGTDPNQSAPVCLPGKLCVAPTGNGSPNTSMTPPTENPKGVGGGEGGGCSLSTMTSSSSLVHWMILTLPALFGGFRRFKKKS